jgi:hypothetical protein
MFELFFLPIAEAVAGTTGNVIRRLSELKQPQ